ncbi:hypothetical protein RhiirA4_481531 [Rhizophagus irregularis]|uniref:DUF8211 domain-containing protein n=1 Tax=Rhizophagus irregularis TaxID=588596 RepID=A0A2I1HJM8_9GLOM|nr:hypothetical protein RhiirA4_481531 [Rhizophagus irregularis]
MAEGRLALDNFLENNTILQENTLATTIINAPSPPLTTLSNFSFLVSFEKFHVTTAHKAGYNKIYEFRRSKSFFFEVVDQIPDTNEIHLKIYTNDYQMSSTPIRYRFYFGIYVACNHISTKRFSHQKPTLCIIPCPFVKNFGRHACAQHHSLVLFNKKPSSRDESIPIVNNNSRNNKSVHANIIYEKYTSEKSQKIFSNRLGISYETKYIARDLKTISPPNKVEGLMYTKTMKGFTRTPSVNPRTARRQKTRFDRALRRVFGQDNKRIASSLKLRHKIKLANCKKFLFSSCQQILSRVQHLKFNKSLFRTSPNVPLYRFPYDRNCTLLHIRDDIVFPAQVRPSKVIKTDLEESDEENNISSDDDATTKAVNSYRDWYISNLIDEHYGTGASEYIDAVMLIQDSTVLLSLRDAQMLGLNQDRIDEIKSRDRANERINVIKDIKDHNTSAKHYLRRTNAMDFFTKMNNAFDEKIAGIRKFAFGLNKSNKNKDKRALCKKRLENLVLDFGKKFKEEHGPFKPYRAIIRPNDVQYVKDDFGDTSDDTKILERRPKKRRARTSHYHNVDHSTHLTKKSCIFDCRNTKEMDFLPANIDLFFEFRF